jgi:hypothetical protein
MRHYITRSGGPLAGFLAVATIGMGAAAPASAVPAQSPFPDTTHYERVVDIEQFKVTDEEGIWFTTPVGLYCGIGDDGSYGCSGDLPGAPSGENEVGWFPGDPFPRLYHTDEPRFASGRRQSILAGQTYVEYRGSRCAVTMESGIYCMHGDDRNSQIMVTSGMTWRGSDAIPSS